MLIGSYFSGTGTTEKIIKEMLWGAKMTDGLNSCVIEDFSLPERRERPLIFKNEDLVFLGIFVVAGRLPNLLIKYLSTMEIAGAKVVPVVLFGNRDYQDALAELRDIIVQRGGKVIGGAAFIGEHSFSEILGKGRPDAKDLETAKHFGEMMGRKFARGIDDCEQLEEMGSSYPYFGYYKPRKDDGTHIDIRKVKPVTSEECVDCGICVRGCRMGAIDRNPKTVSGVCIKCCFCIKKCPMKAKKFTDEGFLFHKKDLEEKYADERKSPEIFS